MYDEIYFYNLNKKIRVIVIQSLNDIGTVKFLVNKKMNFTAGIFFCFIFVLCVHANIDNTPVCYGSVCPMGTTSCKKHIKSTGYGYLQIKINCLDYNRGSLKEYYFENPTTMDQNTNYESTSYSDIAGTNPYPQTLRSGNNEVGGLRGYYGY